MDVKLSRAAIHRGMRWTLVLLFIGQGLLKAIMFLMPATIAYFEALGSPAWLPALVVATELFLVVQLALGLAGFYPAPPEDAGECAEC
jgi:uncharacterized membrane protein YphA (DoxX/SURF4 family)